MISLHHHARPLVSLVLDTIVLCLGFVLAYAAIFLIIRDRSFVWDLWLLESGRETLLLIVFQMATMFFLGGYDFSLRVFLARRLSRRVIGLVIGTILGIFCLVFVLLAQDIHRLAILLQVSFAIVGLTLSSILARRLMLRLGHRSTAVIVTETTKGKELAQELLSFAQPQYNKLAMVSAEEFEKAPRSQALSTDNAGNYVFELAGGKTEALWLEHAVEAQSLTDIVTDLDGFYTQLTGHPHSDCTGAHAIAAAITNENLQSFSFRITQRIRDFLISAVALTFAAPLCAIIAIAIKLDSKGPILFVQERLGQFKRPFLCLKFRTMVNNAEAESGPRWATIGDPRVTRLGKFLRKSRLDELPQLLNVLRGDMNIVGPRPIRDHFARQYKEAIPSFDLRFLVKPGLTGWAQLRHRDQSSFEEQLEKFGYDIFYISQASHDFDFSIMIGTAKILIRRTGI